MNGSALSSETVHASCVATGAGDGARAVLLAGRSGSGKSDLALRLIDRGWELVSDDYTLVRRVAGRLIASPPARIEGRIEIRGLGIVMLPYRAETPVALVCDLDMAVQRLPEPGLARWIAGVSVPVVALAALELSAPIKVERALTMLAAR